MEYNNISIIIPVYNTEKYLKKCLDSIVNQKTSFHEIILINDCSTDNSLQICHEYEFKYNNIKLINLNKNMGPGYARNEGLKIATGKYIYFCDSDDYIIDNFDYINNNIDIIQFNIKIKKECIINRKEGYPKIIKNVISNNKLINYSYLPRGLYCYIFRKAFLINNNIWFNNTYRGEDWLFLNKILLCNFNIEFLPETKYCRRLHYNSLSTKTLRENNIQDYILNIDELYNLSKHHNLHKYLIQKEISVLEILIKTYSKDININIIKKLKEKYKYEVD